MMIVRRYHDDDLASVVRLFTETVHQVCLHDYTAEQVAAWAPQPPDLVRWRERLARLTLWVADSGHGLLGFCGLGVEGHVDLLYTDHRFQRQGVARSLYQQVETEARSLGVRRLFTEASITARPFFASMGFGIIRGQMVESRGVIFKNYAMEKYLHDA
jgi:putative acetyltransferase